MDVTTLNEILSFIEADFRAADKLPASGQRVVFQGPQVSTNINCIIKLCAINPINVGRIQREIRVLGGLDSEYFPKLFYQTFITDSILLDFYDSFDTRQADRKHGAVSCNSSIVLILPISLTRMVGDDPWKSIKS